MTTIGEHIYNGMGAAATVLGFLFVILGAALAILLIVYGVMLIVDLAPKDKGKEVRGRAGTSERYQPHGYAPTVGRHVRKGL